MQNIEKIKQTRKKNVKSSFTRLFEIYGKRYLVLAAAAAAAYSYK